jgi:Enoyl-CoA hydratase/isomerase
VTEAELCDLLRPPSGLDDDMGPAGCVLVVALDGSATRAALLPASDALASLACVVIGIAGDEPSDAAVLADMVVAKDDPALIAAFASVEARPSASTALAVLLRGADHRPIGEGLAAESAVYSTLQGGPEFAEWRASRPIRPRPPESGPPVRVTRTNERLLLTLSRPHVRNALDARMRDALVEALMIAAADPSITDIVITGDGPSFCAGGDLDEFGSFPDPAAAHLIRLSRSPARVLAALADRVTVRLHGACLGSGIELPAFVHRVTARPGTTIALPEIGLGLIPGAGGTVSLPGRIGRQRTAWLALTRSTIDVETALEWGLVDAIVE